MASGIVSTIESAEWLDRAADPVQQPIANLLSSVPTVADAVHGRWLGHSLHAALTDIPIGAWTAGLVLDALSSKSWRDRSLRRGADTVHAVGLVAALAAAVTGLADWSRYAQSSGKRLGLVHATTNVIVSGLFGGSLLARSKGARGTGIALAGAGFGLLGLSAWLGRELTYKLGVNVGMTSEKAERDNRFQGVPESGQLEKSGSAPPSV